MKPAVTCKLGLVLPQALHAQMIPRTRQVGRGGLQAAYAKAFEGLLSALDTGEAVSFAAVRAPKIRVTLRLPEGLCARIRQRVARLTLKLTDFACAAVGRTPAVPEGT